MVVVSLAIIFNMNISKKGKGTSVYTMDPRTIQYVITYLTGELKGNSSLQYSVWYRSYNNMGRGPAYLENTIQVLASIRPMP